MQEPPSDPADWFRAAGWEVLVTEDPIGTYWANLVSIENPDFVVARYGKGDTTDAAVERAQARWRVEQIGTTGDKRPKPGLP